MPELIVVGVDGSETAHTVAHLATATGAGLHVLAAFDKHGATPLAAVAIAAG